MIETLENRYADRPYRVELTHAEFTSICPLTGAPDFGTLTIRYVPADRLLELKSVRDFLAEFRGREILQEEVVNAVLQAILESAAPRFAEVEGIFNVRGGIGARVVARAGEEPAA